MKNWELEDVEESTKANPSSFFIPPKTERKSQKIGDEVRLHFILNNPTSDQPRAERMWVEITKERGLFSKYKGLLTNQPDHIKELNIGDKIEFEAKHIARTVIKKDSPLWIDSAEQKALVSEMCFQEGEIVRFLYREDTERDEDSGWKMFSGTESEEYSNNPNNIRIVNVSYLLDLDPTLLIPLIGKVGAVFERETLNSDWQEVKDWTPNED
ncbi:MAG: DUF2185 domain-containing protein [Reichenbachiella sp.]